MAATIVADASFLVALLAGRDHHHGWAAAQARERPPPWHTCEAALSEAFFLLGPGGAPVLSDLLRRQALRSSFSLTENLDAVLALIGKYSRLPMSLADACLVRMTETMPEPIILTTDADFRIYRRHSRMIVPCVLPTD